MDTDICALVSIRRAIQEIDKYTKYGWGAFEAEELFPVWAIWHLQRIHEIANRMSPQFRDQHPELPSTLFQEMPHLLTNEDLTIDTEAVWLAVTERLIPIEDSIERILTANEDRAQTAP